MSIRQPKHATGYRFQNSHPGRKHLRLNLERLIEVCEYEAGFGQTALLSRQGHRRLCSCRIVDLETIRHSHQFFIKKLIGSFGRDKLINDRVVVIAAPHTTDKAQPVHLNWRRPMA